MIVLKNIFNPATFLLSCSVLIGGTRSFAQQCFKGWADDVFPMEICLEFNEDRDVQGSYSFVGTDLSFDLQGFSSADTIRLLEYDKNGYISGYLILKFQKDMLRGKWMNVDKNLTSGIVCYDPEKYFVTDNCAANKWIKDIRYEVDGSAYDMVLIRSAQQIAFGYFNREGGDRQSFRGLCRDKICSEVDIEDDPTKHTPSVVTFSGKDKVQISFSGVNDEINGTVNKVWSLDCLSKISYTGSVDIQYPVVDEVFERELLQWTDKWMHEVDFRKKISLGEPTDLPEHRWSNRYYSWLEIDLISDNFISGVIEFIGPDGGIDGFAFNYNTDEKAFLDIGDYLKKDLNVSTLSELFEEEHSEHVDWSYATISKQGIVLRSGFDEIFGFRKYILPYDTYDKYIRGSLFRTVQMK